MEKDLSRFKDFIVAALQEDIGAGDHSSLAVIDTGLMGTVALKIKEVGVLAGMEVAEAILKHLEPSTVFRTFKRDGDRMQVGETAFEAVAHVQTLLKAERLILNCMQRMSGIATLTAAYVDKIRHFNTRILDTRKTTPNFRLLEKEAVRIGGALNHRFGLYDMIMLKDNHIDFAGGVEKAVLMADAYRKQHNLNIGIEVETRSMQEVVEVCRIGKGRVFRIMLDNFTPDQVAEAVDVIAGRFETECSGGIHLATIEAYAATGVDYVSIGALVHHAVSLDLSLKAVK